MVTKVIVPNKTKESFSELCSKSLSLGVGDLDKVIEIDPIFDELEQCNLEGFLGSLSTLQNSLYSVKKFLYERHPRKHNDINSYFDNLDDSLVADIVEKLTKCGCQNK